MRVREEDVGTGCSPGLPLPASSEGKQKEATRSLSQKNHQRKSLSCLLCTDYDRSRGSGRRNLASGQPGHPLTVSAAFCFGLGEDSGFLIQTLLLVLGGVGCKGERKTTYLGSQGLLNIPFSQDPALPHADRAGKAGLGLWCLGLISRGLCLVPHL